MTPRNVLHCLCTASLVLSSASALGAKDIAQEPTSDRALQVEDMSCSVMVVPQDAAATGTNVVVKTGKKAVGYVARGVVDIFRGTKKTIDAEAGKKELSTTYRAELKRGNWLPMTTEVEYGRRSHDLIADSLLERDSELGKLLYPRADALLDEIKRGIDKPYDYDFKVFIREESTLNAMALPGGFLYLDAGLLKDRLQHDKARFALAHEVGHVLQRHETRELQGLIVDSYQDGKELQEAVANSRQGKDQALALLKNVKISKDSYVRHTLDQELQADACSVRLIFSAYPGGKELSASINAFIESLPATLPTAKSPPAFPAVVHDFVTLPADRHPNSAERTKHLHEVQAALVAPATKQSG